MVQGGRQALARYEINVVSEALTTHKYESKTLAKAFERDHRHSAHPRHHAGRRLVEKLQTQMQSGRNIYDGWVNDSDLIGTHFRYGKVVPISEMMKGKQGHPADPGPEGLHRSEFHHRARMASHLPAA